MSRTTRRNSWMLGIAVVSALAIGTALAQNGSMHGKGSGRASGAGERRDAMREVLSQLDLSDDQKAGIRGIFQSQKPILGPLAQQTGEARRGLFESIHAATLDEGSIRAASDRLAKAQLALALERARTVARVRELLTPEQRKQLDAARESRLERRQEHGRHQRGTMRDGMDDSIESF